MWVLTGIIEKAYTTKWKTMELIEKQELQQFVMVTSKLYFIYFKHEKGMIFIFKELLEIKI